MKNIIKKYRIVLACFIALILQRGNVVAQTDIKPDNALKHYIELPDNAYRWKLMDSSISNGAVVYHLILTSQTWRNIIWKHQLSIIIPDKKISTNALLFISGGSIKNGIPSLTGENDDLINSLSAIAVQNLACVALLKEVPNQPLYGGLTEDALISYTLHQFQQSHDYTWPLLFPMVKSAVKAMDAVQEFTLKNCSEKVDSFIVSGISKRGWTAWLAGASDKRVMAIAPMVIDVLNMPVSLEYQIKTWKKYSAQIRDYVKLGIPQQAYKSEGGKLLAMLDPYSYRDKLMMPKMIFMGANDQYWVVDNIKNYYDSLKGINLLQYIPNAGHNLGDKQQAFTALNAFFATAIQHKQYNIISWKTNPPYKHLLNVDVKCSNHDVNNLVLWQAYSNDADIRNNVWLPNKINIRNSRNFVVPVQLPESGYKAFYIALTYDSPTGGQYQQMTRVFVIDSTGLVENSKKQ